MGPEGCAEDEARSLTDLEELTEERRPGTYCLLLRLQRQKRLTAGRLGSFDFPRGFYVYTGSALGGLRGRLRRYLQPVARPHWHIDYLRSSARLRGVWILRCEERLECIWSSALRELSEASLPAPGFGASDCRCATHLVYFEDKPDLGDLLTRVSPGRVLWVDVAEGDLS